MWVEVANVNTRHSANNLTIISKKRNEEGGLRLSHYFQGICFCFGVESVENSYFNGCTLPGASVPGRSESRIF